MKWNEKLRIAAAVLLIAALIVFVIANIDEIEVRLLFARVKMPIAFVVIFSAAAGAVVTWALRFVKKKQ